MGSTNNKDYTETIIIVSGPSNNGSKLKYNLCVILPICLAGLVGGVLLYIGLLILAVFLNQFPSTELISNVLIEVLILIFALLIIVGGIIILVIVLFLLFSTTWRNMVISLINDENNF